MARLRMPPAAGLKRALWFAPLLACGALAFWRMLLAMYGRVGYLYELEWMEGAMLQQVLRVVHGLPLYGEATLDFVPALYMPLYYWLAALSVSLFGENLLALRMVSVSAALGAHWLVYAIVRRVSGSALAGLAGIGLFAATYPHTAFWFDVARVDSLWTCLLAAAVYAMLRLREQPSPARFVQLVVICLAAFAAKQATLFMMPFLALALLCWTGWGTVIRFTLVFTATAAVLLVLLQWMTGGEFFFYAFRMAGTHGVTAFGFQRFGLDILFTVAFTVLLAALHPLLAPGRWREKAGWWALLAGFFCLSMLSRAYAGAFFNVLMPLHFCAVILATLTCAVLVERAMAGHWVRGLLAALAVGLLTVETARHHYEPRAQWPTDATRQGYQQLLQRVAAVDGRVCFTAHGYLAWLAGKGFCAHNTQVTDLVTGSDPERAQRLRADARLKILTGYYAVIVLDREKELNDLGLQLSDIPYTVENIEYPQGPVQFPVNGRPPTLWLQYNGATLPQETHNAR